MKIIKLTLSLLNAALRICVSLSLSGTTRMTLSLPITENWIGTLGLFAAVQWDSKQVQIATVIVLFFSICNRLRELQLCS